MIFKNLEKKMQGEEEQVSKYGNKNSSVSLNRKPQTGHTSWLHCISSSGLFKICLFVFFLLTQLQETVFKKMQGKEQ